jgi:hypothetical protein
MSLGGSMTANRSWPTGTVIVQQEVWNGRPWSARPMTVVEDRPELPDGWNHPQ